MESQVIEITAETSGCGFYMICNGKTFNLHIPKTGISFSGNIETVFKKFIQEVKSNRVKSKTGKKPFRYE